MKTPYFMDPARKRMIGLILGLIALTGGVGQAGPLFINDPIYVDSQSPAAPHYEAGTVAHIFDETITLDNAAFFPGAWQSWQHHGNWTLVNGGSLPGLTLNVMVFDAYAAHTDNHTGHPGVGGVEILVEVVYDGADRNELYWVQGLYTNYLPGDNPALVAPYYALDISTANGVEPPPLYPFQYVTRAFYDFPKGPFDGAFFDADAFICKIDRTNGVLTLYDGIEYGFYLYVVEVPEPSTWLLLLMGVAIVVQFGGTMRLRNCSSQRLAA